MKGRNSGRTGGCDLHLKDLALNEQAMHQAVALGNRATRRAATRNLKRLSKLQPREHDKH